MNKAVIVEGVRLAYGAHVGQWRDVPIQSMTASCVREVVKRAGVDPMEIEDVIMGNIHAEHGNIARRVALEAGLPIECAATTVDRQCGSGTTAIANAALAIQAGLGEIYVACGGESMTRSPWQMEKPSSAYPYLVPKFVKYTYATSEIGETPMPQTADILGKKFGISRLECDEWALISHQRAVKAINDGVFKDQILPYEVKSQKGSKINDTDEPPKPDTSLEKLSKLPPLFKDGLTTAGNACPRSDGAGALLMMSEDKAKSLGLKPIISVKTFAVAGCDPNIMGWGPVPSTRKALKRAGLTLSDIDVIEMNEAFAAQFLACVKDLDMDPEKVNPNGGAIALGHPLGGTGVILTVKLMDEMVKKNYRFGLVTMCIGGGQGMASIFERC